MDSFNWLTLADYSAKYKVSVSTLRRRIKNDKIEYAFENGKYFLPDMKLKDLVKAKKSFSPAPPQQKKDILSSLEIGQHFSGKDFLESFMTSQEEEPPPQHSTNEHSDEFHQSRQESRSDFERAFEQEGEDQSPAYTLQEDQDSKEAAKENDSRASTKEALEYMTKELKKAYSAILQEKEEQLILLKEQVADLKTLVNILEEENQRMRPGHEEEPIVAPHVIREKSQF